MGIFQKPNTLLLDIEPKNPATLTYQNRNMIGPEQSDRILTYGTLLDVLW